jgi:hypothetical protein
LVAGQPLFRARRGNGSGVRGGGHGQSARR